MRLPLVHRSRYRFPGRPYRATYSLYDTPAPSSFLSPSTKTNTYFIDRKLKLGDYVFMGWGAPEDAHGGSVINDSDFAVLVEPSLLESGLVIVTEKDLACSVSRAALHYGIRVFDEQDAEDTKAQIERYRDGIVSGRDWIGIQSARLALGLKTQKVPMSFDSTTFGEIKHRGPIPRSAIMGVLDLRNEDEYRQYVDYIHDAYHGLLEPAKSGPLPVPDTI